MTIFEELEKIRVQNNGVVYPKSVVDFARDPTTELHTKFDWDDATASEKYRLWQARQIIVSVMVHIIPKEKREIQAYVSLKNDRYTKVGSDSELSGGYRFLVDVLQTPALRKTLLEEAIEEFESWQTKYQDIKELVDIFDAAKTVKQKSALLPITA